jgi:hypothetical protein
MKMNNQSRNFARQAQTDLLALCDADLVQIVHQWVDKKDSSGILNDIPDETYIALGYTRGVPANTIHENELGQELDMPPPPLWQAPSPQHLRTLLTAMDVDIFAQHVITLAFQSLHTIYPQWYEGAIFNAHLANHLRRISMKRETISKEQSLSI